MSCVRSLLLVASLVFFVSGCSYTATKPNPDNAVRRWIVHYEGAPPDLAGATVLRRVPELGLMEVAVDNSRLFFQADDNVVLEPNLPRELFEMEDPTLAWHLQAIGATEAWRLSRGCGVVVAVVDTLPDLTHPDLTGRWVTGFDAFTGLEITAPSDLGKVGDHGTHVSGIVAADGGAKGIAPCAKLMPVQVFKDGRYVGDAGAAQAIRWAVDHGAQVLNMSWGGPGYSLALAKALEYAESNGVVLVAAAGNEGVSIPMYPAAFPGVLAVASVGGNLSLSTFSSRGYFVHLAAPGERILSTLPHESYGFYSGTSMAAPLVSGSVALLLSRNSTLDPWQLKSLLWDNGSSVIDDERLRIIQPAQALAAAEAPSAQGCLKIEVTSSDGSEVRLADLRLRGEDGEVYWRKADASGLATFYGIGPGEYTLQVAGPEWPDLKSEERVIYNTKVNLTPKYCQKVLITLTSWLTARLSWDFGDLDLAVKEGNWDWSTAKLGAQFGLFSEDATRGGVESYRFTGGISDTKVKFGVLNHENTEVAARLEIDLNGQVKLYQLTIPPGESVFLVDSVRVLD